MEVLKLLTVNLDALGAIQNAYGGREAFNVHSRGGGIPYETDGDARRKF